MSTEFEDARQETQAEQRRDRVLNALCRTVLADGKGKLKTNPVERILQTHLDRYFPGKIHRELTLSRPAYSYSFYPDVAYVDTAWGLCIDIEIDEPYVYRSKKPIHYTGKDDSRNQFFLEQGWLVIRFSEEQAVCHPDGCCETIASVVAELTGDRSVLSLLESVPDLELMQQWTCEVAESMAKVDSRDQYLSTLQSYYPVRMEKPLLRRETLLTA